MTNDAYNLFSKCQLIYLAGMRNAIRERLAEQLGNRWWENGFLPYLSDIQRESRFPASGPSGRPDLTDYLDSQDFVRIIGNNHPLAFSDALPDWSETQRQLYTVINLRNEWAHPPSTGLDPSQVRLALDAMVWLLVSLRCPEALEVQSMRDNELEKSTDTGMSQASDEPQEATLPDAGDLRTSLWSEIQSYLSVAINVDDNPNDRNPDKLVTVRVTNTAPVGPGQPEVAFMEVTLESSVGSGRSSQNLRRLEPGQSVEREFEVPLKQLASVEFTAIGNLDRDRYFRLSRLGQISQEIVAPLIAEFTERLAGIKVEAVFSGILALLGDVGPSMTLDAAGAVRNRLAEGKVTLGEKKDQIQELFHDFHLDKQTRLGALSHEVFELINGFAKQMNLVDEGIGNSDLSGTDEAIRQLGELRLALLQLEESAR